MKILIYTDSRGQFVGKGDRYPTYIELLKSKYDIESYICPEKWTTSMDFLRCINGKDMSKYDIVILQTSVVENSPRSKSDAFNKIYKDINKKNWFDFVFGEDNMIKHYETDFGIDYEGEKSLNLFSGDMGVKYLVPILEMIPNLIWISNNPLVGGDGSEWLGSYWKQRPRNMKIVNDISKKYIDNMVYTKVIDNTNWSDDEIKKYTTDNIHYTKEGMEYIYDKIMGIISSM